MLNGRRFAKALEVGCAEGHFTAQLAPLVRSLLAADISQVALERAAVRCADCRNVSFMRLDLVADALPGTFDLIVCSEVLYYLDGLDVLELAVRKLAGALEPGGHLLTAHASVRTDEGDGTGFDWEMPFGSKVIGEVLGRTPPLELVDEITMPLFRIFLHRAGEAS
jgi:SAM-dependent methyltransferase